MMEVWHETIRIDVEEGSRAYPERQKKRRHVRSCCDFTFSELVLPAKTSDSPLPGKLIIFKRLQVKALNLPDKFWFFGL